MHSVGGSRGPKSSGWVILSQTGECDPPRGSIVNRGVSRDDDDVMYYYKAQLAVTNMAPVTPHIIPWVYSRLATAAGVVSAPGRF